MRLLIITGIGLLAGVCQANAQSLPLTAPPPAPPAVTVSSIVGGVPNTTYYYMVMANYPGGQVQSQIIQARNTSPLSGTVYNQIGWQPLTGAITYDVLRLPTTEFTGTCACAVVTALPATAISYQDTGGSLSSYTASAPALAASASIQIDNTDYAFPKLRVLIGNAPQGQQANHLGEVPSGSTLPAYCTVGDIFVKLGASAGVYACLTANTWTIAASGSATGYVIYTSGLFSTACAAAVAANATLVIATAINAIPVPQTCAANLQFFKGGIVQPAGTGLTLSGTVSAAAFQIFDTSIGGNGSILLTGPNPAIYPNWFGAKMDGSTDDTAAWNATIASCSGTCRFAMPAGANSYTASGITFNFPGPSSRITLDCAGSTVSGTGVAVVSWTGTSDFQDSGAEDCQFNDSVGNTATKGIYVNGGASCCSGNTRLTFRRIKAIGSGLGTGIVVNNAVLTRVYDSTFGGWNIAGQSTGFANIAWYSVGFVENVTYDYDKESSGEENFYSPDFEGTTGGTGLRENGGAIYLHSGHAESNPTNQMEVVAGEVFSYGYTWAGGTAQVDSGATWVSNGDQLSGVTVLNNSTGGGSEDPGAVFIYPLLGPAINTASTGWTQFISRAGISNTCYSGGVLTPCGNNYAMSGASVYSTDNINVSQFNTSVIHNPNYLAKDTNPSATSACFAMQGTFIGSAEPTICWQSVNGGFTFFPSPASTTIGTNDYNFLNGAGMLIGSGSDSGIFSFYKLAISQIPTSAGSGGLYVCVDSSGYTYKKSSCP
jgi:hypothetical protein